MALNHGLEAWTGGMDWAWPCSMDLSHGLEALTSLLSLDLLESLLLLHVLHISLFLLHVLHSSLLLLHVLHS